MQMTNLIGSPRNAIRAIPRLPILIAAVVAVVSGLLLASALTSPTARAQQLTETVWTATMTVGTTTSPFGGPVAGYNVAGYTDEFIPDGALSPATFSYAGETLTVNRLMATEAGLGPDRYSLQFVVDRQLPGLTLHLGGREFQIADARYIPFTQEYIWSGIDDFGWSAGDTVQVRLKSALTSPTVRAQQLTETVWTATMTVGTAFDFGDQISGYDNDLIPGDALSPDTFSYAGETLTVSRLMETEGLVYSLTFSAGRQLPGHTLHLGDREFQTADAEYYQDFQEYIWFDIDDLVWSAGDTVQVRLEWEVQTARGERINNRLEADGEWHGYELEPDLYYCKVQCYWEGHRFVVDLQVNRRYIVEVDSEQDSKDPRLFEVEPRAVPNMFISNSTGRMDRIYIGVGSDGYAYTGGHTDVIVDTQLYGYPSPYGNGDFFIRVEGSNGYNERTEEYRIRVRDVTPPLATSQEAKSAGIPQIKPTFLEIAPSGIPSNIIPHSKGVKCGLIRSNSPFSYSNHRPAKPKIPKPLVYAQVSPLGTSFATP